MGCHAVQSMYTFNTRGEINKSAFEMVRGDMAWEILLSVPSVCSNGYSSVREVIKLLIN